MRDTQERHKIKLFQFQKIVSEKDFIIQGLFEKRCNHNQEEEEESKKVLAMLESNQKQNKDLESLKAIQRSQKKEARHHPKVSVFSSYVERIETKVAALKEDALDYVEVYERETKAVLT